MSFKKNVVANISKKNKKVENWWKIKAPLNVEGGLYSDYERIILSR